MNQQDLERLGISIEDFFNVETLVDNYIDYVENLNSKKVNLGFAQFDELTRGLRAQEVLTIIAQTGIGKSALALNLLHNFVKSTHELTVLFSLEMSATGIAERIFQVELDVFGYNVEKKFKNKEEAFIQSCRDLQTTLNNFFIIVKRVDVAQIPQYVQALEFFTKKKVRLVCIDYVGLMENKIFPKDEYLRITDNMKKIYGYAKELDVAIINLSQVSRAELKTNEALSLFSAKGSGEVENSSDFVFALEKLKLNDKDDNSKLIELNEKMKAEGKSLLNLSLLKNRRGNTGNILLSFDHKNLRIAEYQQSTQETFTQAGF